MVHHLPSHIVYSLILSSIGKIVIAAPWPLHIMAQGRESVDFHQFDASNQKAQSKGCRPSN